MSLIPTVHDVQPEEPTPLVIVEGFLGSAGPLLWGNFDKHINLKCEHRRRTIFASVGPVSSLHDRACELYYALIGGTVDYGQEHSLLHNHSRNGRTNPQGLYPEWSREKPLHFLGHSMGGPTIIKLQYLLKRGLFGDRGHPDMILSVNSICSPFRGTQLVYTLGERIDAAPAVRPLSVGAILTKAVHLISYLGPFLPRALDLHSESRQLSYRETSIYSLLKQLWSSDWAESQDAAPFDVTFGAVDERERMQDGALHRKTFYRSHVAYMTQKASKQSNAHRPYVSHVLLNTPFYLSARIMGRFDFSALQPAPSFLPLKSPSSPLAIQSGADNNDVEQGLLATDQSEIGEEYWANDGVVPVFSQWHPFDCSQNRCVHYQEPLLDASCEATANVEPGIWHVYETNAASHVSIVPFWTGSLRQKHFWEDMGRWLRSVDAKRGLKI